MKTKPTLAERIRSRVTKRERAQSRLNRAAVAWAHIYAETIQDPWLYSDRLVRAVRAFQKASKR